MKNKYQINNIGSGTYKIDIVPSFSNKDFQIELNKIGFFVGNIIEILDYSTKNDLYVRINGSIYFLRKKLLKGIYVSKEF